MLLSWLKRRRLRKRLSRYVSPEAIDAIVDNPDADPPPLRLARVGFVAVLVRDPVWEREQLFGELVALCVTHRASVDMGSTLVIAVFGVLAPRTVPLGQPQCLAEAIHDRFGEEVSVVCGWRDGRFGHVGTTTHGSFTTVFPDLRDILTELVNTEFGQVREV